MSDQGNFSEFSNLYEVRKTVRFELVPQFVNPPKSEKSKDIKGDLESFILKYKDLLSNFSQIVFNDNKTKLNSKLKIKFSFLKTYTKREYYENEIERLKKGNNQIELGSSMKLAYLFDRFKILEENNNYFLKQINDIGFRNEENQARKSDLAYWFHQLSKKTNFDFIKELFNDNLNTESELFGKIKETKIITEQLKKLIEEIERTLLPSQSMGQVVEKASFNYYTVNKKPRDYDKEILNMKDDFSKGLHLFTYFNKKENKSKEVFNTNNLDKGFKIYLEQFNEDCFTERRFGEIKKTEKSYMYLKIEKAYNLMKEYKAEQKQAFLQFLSKKHTFQDLKNHLEFDFESINNQTKEKTIKKVKIFLFDDITESNFNNIIELTNQIQSISIQFNQTGKLEIKEKIKKLREERAKYFFEGNREGKFAFIKYGNYCKEYKNIAMQYGRIKALIKSLEKEKIDAERTDSWALILENNNNKYLLTIPRNSNEMNLNNAKKFVDEKIDEIDGLWTLYKFESLTLRALDKLCFGKENNSFRKTIILDKNTYPQFFNGKGFLKDKFEFTKEYNGETTKDDKLLLDFYKAVLNLESTQKQIVIKYFNGFNEFIKKDFDSLNLFEEELKKICYIKQKIVISNETKEKLINDFNARLYKITSYDLQKYDGEILEKLKYKKTLDRKNPENHTQIWRNFWTQENQNNKFPIRINPEIKISFVEKDDYLAKKYSNLEDKKNRKLRDRYTLTTSITENALKKSIDLNFKETKDVLDFYQDYNNRFNGENTFKYYYGLDRGENELVTLGLFDFSTEKPEDQGVKIKVYTLKEEYFKKADERGRLPYRNISYFLEDKYKDYFKEDEVSCMDLTKAKLIKGKIYLNGDVSTYERLKYISETRKDTIGIQKINNLRDAICANMVGIIAFLQQSYPGMMFFENMNIQSKNHLFEKNNITLGSRIEQKLLQKFSSLNQVPPNYKQLFTLQNDNLLSQLGIIGYVNIEGTSVECPISTCRKKLYGHGKGQPWESNIHHYKEGNGIDYGKHKEEAMKTKNDNCDYHMKNNKHGFDYIESGDDLATYNIAKKGYEKIGKYR